MLLQEVEFRNEFERRRDMVDATSHCRNIAHQSDTEFDTPKLISYQNKYSAEASEDFVVYLDIITTKEIDQLIHHYPQSETRSPPKHLPSIENPQILFSACSIPS